MSSWKLSLALAIEQMMNDPDIAKTIDQDHTAGTPVRVVKAFEELFSGCTQNPYLLLSPVFNSTYSQMIHVENISFYSVCAHHLLTFSGTVHFAYIPDGQIVGLSKIPRMIQALSRRPQVQEKMTEEIVGVFQAYLQPKGCAVMVTAKHFCMACRGVREQNAVMTTTALRGCFADNDGVKAEFLAQARK